MIVEDYGLAYDAMGQSPRRRIAFFPSLCRMESGELLCAFQVGSAKHSPDSTVGLCRSDASGSQWRPIAAQISTALAGVPGSLSAPALLEIEPGRLRLFVTWFDRSEPERPLFDPASEGILRSKLLGATSDDDGESWSPWSVLPTADLSGCSLTGPVVRWQDGTIGLAFESFKEFDDVRPARHGSWLMVSQDSGNSFGPPVLLAPRHDVYYWDARLCADVGVDGFVALYWTHDRIAQRDLNVHLRRGAIQGGVARGPQVTATALPGQIAAPALCREKLLAFVVDRTQPGTMRLWQSRDGGRSWPVADSQVIYRHLAASAAGRAGERIDFAQYWEEMGKWTFGHPAVCGLDGERLMLAYYAGTPEAMSIHWARVRVEA